MIRFLDFPQLYTAYPNLDHVIKRVLVTGKLILQKDVEDFEHKLAAFLGVKYVVGLNSGTDALLLALTAAGVGPGDEVISCGHTFKSTIGVIEQLGAQPVLVDITAEGLMDMNQVSQVLCERTKAIIPVHLTGDMADINSLKSILFQHYWGNSMPLVIEDACQALGAIRDGYTAGTFGYAGCFSFYPAKILGAFGDAGALVTNNQALAEDVRDRRNHYKDSHKDFGCNSRLDNLQAAVLVEKMDYVSADITKRQAVAERYNQGFKNLPLGVPTIREGRVYQDYVIRIKARDELYEYLKERGIETIKNEYPFMVGYEKMSLTAEYERETLRLPCNPYITPEEVDTVIQYVRDFYKI